MAERLRDKARRGKGGTYDRRRTARRGAQCRRHRPLKALQGFGDGHEQILTFLDTAEPFGEVPLLDGGSDPASVQAIEPSVIYVLQRFGFERLVCESSDLALGLILFSSLRAGFATRLNPSQIPDSFIAWSTLSGSCRSRARWEI
jgi:hypothetical protein